MSCYPKVGAQTTPTRRQLSPKVANQAWEYGSFSLPPLLDSPVDSTSPLCTPDLLLLYCMPPPLALPLQYFCLRLIESPPALACTSAPLHGSPSGFLFCRNRGWVGCWRTKQER